MIEEESLDAVRCPFCGSDTDCEHLVAIIDMSYRSLEGGALYELIGPLCQRVGAAAARRIRADPGVVSRIRDPHVKDLLEEIESEIGGPDEFGDEEGDDPTWPGVAASEGTLLHLAIEILPELNVQTPSGSVFEGDSPGYSSAMEVYWSRQPEKVLGRLEKRILRMVSTEE